MLKNKFYIKSSKYKITITATITAQLAQPQPQNHYEL